MTETDASAASAASVAYEHSKMTVTFQFANGVLVPKVEFAPVGRIWPQTIERHLGFLYREINKAQTIQRNGIAGTRFELEGAEPPGRGPEDAG